MSLPKASELIKLARACRKVGITSFKSAEFEFTLSEEAPAKSTKKLFIPAAQSQGDIETETLSEEELLFYSVANPLAKEENQ